MRVLVTGGAGFIGSHLVDALIERGDRVRVIDSLEPQVHRGKSPNYLNPKAEYLFGDLSDPSILPKALWEVDSVIHLAALVGVGQSMYQMARYIEQNTLGTTRFLEHLVQRHSEKPIRKLLVASSMSIYGEGLYRCEADGELSMPMRSPERLNRHEWEIPCPKCAKILRPIPTPETKPLCPHSVYAISKRDQEELVLTISRAYRIPAVALRFFNVYGSRQSLSNPYTGACAIFLARIRLGKPPILYEDGQQTRDLIHVFDVVQAILIALDHPQAQGEAFNVGTGKSSSIQEVALALAQVYGSGVSPKISGRYRAGDVRHCVADIRRLQALGFAPRFPLKEGLQSLAQWGSTTEAEDLFEQAEEELLQRNLLGE